jgi:hypothetical protein
VRLCGSAFLPARFFVRRCSVGDRFWQVVRGGEAYIPHVLVGEASHEPRREVFIEQKLHGGDRAFGSLVEEASSASICPAPDLSIGDLVWWKPDDPECVGLIHAYRGQAPEPLPLTIYFVSARAGVAAAALARR